MLPQHAHSELAPLAYIFDLLSQVLATGGDDELGGDDFTRALAAAALAKLQGAAGQQGGAAAGGLAAQSPDVRLALLQVGGVGSVCYPLHARQSD